MNSPSCYLNQFLLVDWSPRGIGADWLHRHQSAVTDPRTGFERAFAELLSGWLRYADSHKRRYESGIGQDGVLGPEWARVGAALRGLLNGDLGRFDGGTLDSVLCQTLEAEGFDPDSL